MFFSYFANSFWFSEARKAKSLKTRESHISKHATVESEDGSATAQHCDTRTQTHTPTLPLRLIHKDTRSQKTWAHTDKRSNKQRTYCLFFILSHKVTHKHILSNKPKSAKSEPWTVLWLYTFNTIKTQIVRNTNTHPRTRIHARTKLVGLPSKKTNAHFCVFKILGALKMVRKS